MEDIREEPLFTGIFNFGIACGRSAYALTKKLIKNNSPDEKKNFIRATAISNGIIITWLCQDLGKTDSVQISVKTMLATAAFVTGYSLASVTLVYGYENIRHNASKDFTIGCDWRRNDFSIRQLRSSSAKLIYERMRTTMQVNLLTTAGIVTGIFVYNFINQKIR